MSASFHLTFKPDSSNFHSSLVFLFPHQKENLDDKQCGENFSDWLNILSVSVNGSSNEPNL